LEQQELGVLADHQPPEVETCNEKIGFEPMDERPLSKSD
jgi:hypothetical protein